MAKRYKDLLNAVDVTNAKAKKKAYRLADGGGLYLWVPRSGTRVWQFRYRHGGKPQTATLGRESKVQGLAWARRKADEARSQVDAGEPLTRVKAVARATKRVASSNTFATVAADWVKSEARRAKWTADYKGEVSASLANHLSELDALPIAEITAAIAAPYLRKMERATPDMARKVRQRLRAIFDYAIEGGLITGNPLPAPRRRKAGAESTHLAAEVDRARVGSILRAAEQSEACKGVQRSHLLLAFTAQRVGEVAPAAWSEIDLKAGTWSIPRERMKRKDQERGAHVVPIPPRLLVMVKDWRRADGDAAVYVCPAPRGDGHITREAVEKFYRRTLDLAGKHSPHSWRTVLSTWANDDGEDTHVIEAQLDHVTGGPVKTAYDRAKRVDLRVELMAKHESALLAARDGAKVVKLATRKAAS